MTPAEERRFIRDVEPLVEDIRRISKQMPWCAAPTITHQEAEAIFEESCGDCVSCRVRAILADWDED